ncbi:BRISC and BRCA1-A complex member 1-like [Corticium candelabrum]|uniref:BRISC and BRCA1-A complex member 1-like n=1 Tax=Corticium candelabrum TaxID=121492 RepID=UPI002E25F721|nr:BRISC and BRCA1-A complex member 1-like [Corticium candelabrum]
MYMADSKPVSLSSDDDEEEMETDVKGDDEVRDDSQSDVFEDCANERHETKEETSTSGGNAVGLHSQKVEQRRSLPSGSCSPGHRQRQKPDFNDGNNSADDQKSRTSDDMDAQEFIPLEPEISLPRVNCKEKIIFCIDLSHEMLSTSFQSKTSEPRSMLVLSKMAVDMFTKIKTHIGSHHEIAFIALRDKAEWVHDFTRHYRVVCSALTQLHTQQTAEEFDLSSLFSVILDHVELPEVPDVTLPPPYTVRVILMYGRSQSLPTLNSEAGKEALATLSRCPYFFLDVLYIHEVPSSSNQCERIFDELYHLDLRVANYCVEASQHTVKIFNLMGALLAHPLQRPIQDERKPWRV